MNEERSMEVNIRNMDDLDSQNPRANQSESSKKVEQEIRQELLEHLTDIQIVMQEEEAVEMLEKYKEAIRRESPLLKKAMQLIKDCYNDEKVFKAAPVTFLDQMNALQEEYYKLQSQLQEHSDE